MNKAESPAFLIRDENEYPWRKGKHEHAHSCGWVHVINFYRSIILRQYLYLSSISTFWTLNLLCVQTSASICTSKMVEYRLLVLSPWQRFGGKRSRRDLCLLVTSICFDVGCIYVSSKVSWCSTGPLLCAIIGPSILVETLKIYV